MITRFKPHKYIKNKQLYPEYQCKICYELTDAPMRCQGPCRAVFCQHCITFTKNSIDRCPLRCSDTFLVEPIPNLQFDYQCPFDPEHCQVPIKRRLDFHNHYRQCQNAPKQYLTQIQTKKNYICDHGHKLLVITKYLYEVVFEDSQYQNIYRLKCVSCFDEGVCPSICIECTRKDAKAVYCIECRTIPCGRFECPLGHMWFGKSVDGFIGLKNSQICHFCGISPGIVGKACYFDTLCGLRLCEICYKALPNENGLIPLRHTIYAKQEARWDFSLAAFKEDQRLARRELQAQIQAQQRNQREYLENQSSEDSSVERQLQNLRRFFNGEKIRHSSSQSSESEESEESQQNRYRYNRDRFQQQRPMNLHEENAMMEPQLNQLIQKPLESSQQQGYQDQFFSIESEPDCFQSQFQKDQYFQCGSEEKKTLVDSIAEKLKAHPKDSPL